MDNIWIFLVIIGAIFSFAQKNQSKRQGSDTPTEGNNEEEPVTPHEMMERRLRELLGEEQTKRVPTPTSAPTSTTPTARQGKIKPIHGTLGTHPTTASSQQKTTTQTLSVAQYKAEQAKTANNNANNKPSSPTIKPAHASTNNGQIGQIIDDFSMEKAVIYSEILKPKFEEF
jgi:hypothetical protein